MPAFSDSASDAIASSLAAVPAGTPVSEVARRLLELLTGGEVAPGTRLPPERQLASTLGVGRSAVREALAALEILGIVDVRPGSGTYLRGSASDLLPQTLRWGLMIGKQNTDQLNELRAGLESYTARLAADRISAEQLEKLRGTTATMAESLEDLKAFVAADAAFHEVLATAADNAMLTDLLQVTRSLLRVYNDRAVRDRDDMEAAHAEHAQILAALEERNGERAASAMVAHMATARDRILEAAED
ncbi:FadR family transcriptional regulator [Brachybacterium sp. MASK1Z-5]|uniref:FadR family transcriptional regulator n=1 Tax=Brachybacterium halotolerans TaxID=2795215 RepID=A0ABS1BE19_9MICO|nr:FadR/GntR family transcriptional regulator [Brachybacterium halotolerans]MBK0332889.1 FadR family transcriptional regulator [Brachybacterium halotolerans]